MDAESQSSAAALTLSNGLSRPLNAQEIELLTQLDRLKHFLATAPSRWTNTSNPANHFNGSASTSQQQTLNAQMQPVVPSNHPALNRFLLPSSEYVSCVLWSGLYHITGTDIVRALVFRFEAFGRPVINMKKFEEGVFSDLRNLKPGTDACLEEPKSPFLDLLFKYQCIRTQKKQKVFYWFSVPHDRLFLDALERDLKREKMGLEPTTLPRGEPAISFKYDPKRTLYEQYLKPTNSENGGDEEEVDELQSPVNAFAGSRGSGGARNSISVISPADIMARRLQATLKQEDTSNMLSLSSNNNASSSASSASVTHKTFLHMFSLFEGSPTYKQRRKKAGSNAKHPSSTNAAAIEKVDMARRKSVLAGESLMRRNSTLSGIPEMSGLHPSLVGASGYPRMDQPGSRPQSAQQPLPSYGLSMNPTASSERDDHHERPGSQHQTIQLSNHASHSGNNMSQQETTRAYRCPLYSCGALFRRAEELKKHLPNHGMSALIRSRATSNATNTSDGHGNMGGGLKYPCDKGCGKVFSRADLLRMHQSACTGASSGWMGNMHANSGEELDELAEDAMDLEGDIQEVEVPVNSRFEDDLPSSGSISPPNPPGSSHGSTSTFQQQQERYYLSNSADSQQQQNAYDTGYGRGRGHHLPPVLTPKFAVATSAETSPYVETPEGGGAAQWASIPAHPSHHALAGQHSLDNHHQHPSAGHHGHVLNHHMSHHNLGTIQSPPGSAHSAHSLAGRSVFGQQQLHPAAGRYQSPEFNLYTGYPHPSSAPSHKATFDQATLHPPTYHQNGGMIGLSLRRHRSAAPMMGSGGPGSLLHQRHDQPPRTQHSHVDSRPASSAGGESNYEYGNVIVNPPNGHPFAYSVDSGDGRGAMGYMPPGSAGGPVAAVGTGPASDHSSPLSYGQVAIGPNGEYTESNSPYESGGSPGSVGHGQMLPQPVPVPVPMPLSQPPMLPIAPIGYGMRGHMHSLSSEIATQQMQQYVDFDGGAEESHQQQQQGGSSNGHEGAYLQQQSVAPTPYRGNSSEGGNHEEVYQQYHYQHPPPMHLPHQYGYGAPVEQQVAL